MELFVPVNLSVKNVPDALAEELRQRAARNRRSLQRELMTILEAAVAGAVDLRSSVAAGVGRGLAVDQLAERARSLFPKGTPSSVPLIREQRDGRQGAQWAADREQPPRR